MAGSYLTFGTPARHLGVARPTCRPCGITRTPRRPPFSGCRPFAAAHCLRASSATRAGPRGSSCVVWHGLVWHGLLVGRAALHGTPRHGRRSPGAWPFAAAHCLRASSATRAGPRPPSTGRATRFRRASCGTAWCGTAYLLAVRRYAGRRGTPPFSGCRAVRRCPLLASKQCHTGPRPPPGRATRFLVRRVARPGVARPTCWPCGIHGTPRHAAVLRVPGRSPLPTACEQAVPHRAGPRPSHGPGHAVPRRSCGTALVWHGLLVGRAGARGTPRHAAVRRVPGRSPLPTACEQAVPHEQGRATRFLVRQVWHGLLVGRAERRVTSRRRGLRLAERACSPAASAQHGQRVGRATHLSPPRRGRPVLEIPLRTCWTRPTTAQHPTTRGGSRIRLRTSPSRAATSRRPGVILSELLEVLGG